MDGILKILFVEDVIRDAELIWRQLEKNGISFKKILVDNRKDFLQGLKSFKPDIIISDYSLPQFDGMNALLLRNELAPQTPFIIVTGSVNEEVAVECMKAGAEDYVIKEHLTRLPFAVKEVLEQHRIQVEKRAAEILLKENEEKLQSIFSCAPVGIGLVVNRIFMEVNDTFCKMTGYNRKELIGKNSEMIYATNEEYERVGIEKYRQIAEKGTGSFETRFKCKDGRILNIFLSSAPLDKDDLTKGTTFTAMDITERIQAEEALTKEKYLIYSLMDTLPDHIYFKDLKSRFIRINKAQARFLGLDDPRQAVGKTDNDFFTGEHARQAYKDEQTIIRTGQPMSMEERETHPNRPDTWVSTVKLPLYNKEGNIIGTFGISRDITESKQAEEKLRSSEARLKILFDYAPDAYYLSDLKGNFIDGNIAAEKLMGHDKNELIGKNFLKLNLLSPKQLPRAAKSLIKNSLGQATGPDEFVINRKDGSKVTAEIITHPVKIEGKTLVLGIARDITERKRAKEALQQSYNLNESLLKTIPFGMDIVDEKGNILFRSDNFKELIGKDAIGKKCWELYRDDKTQCTGCPLKRGITIGETATYESNGVLGNRIFEITHTGMIYQNKKAMLEIFQDITEKKEKEEELINAKERAEESDRLKSAFLNNMSHEIRTPMNAIVGFSDLLNTSLTPENRDEYVKIINTNSNQLLKIIEDVIEVSRFESEKRPLKIQAFSIKEFLNDIYQTFYPKVTAQKIDFRFSLATKKEYDLVEADYGKIRQVMTGFIDNALKFTQKGSIEFGCLPAGDKLKFFVKDTGMGIPADIQQKIFDRFYRGKVAESQAIRGTGLGLSIAENLVKLMGGTIGVESGQGEGSMFYFVIPVKQAEIEIPSEVVTESGINHLKNLSVLIVEDEPYNYQYLETLLNSAAKKVCWARNGEDAVTLMNLDKFDLVLMDLKMPVMDGLEATRIIKDRYPGIPVIAQSAYSQPEEITSALNAGCDAYLAKPIGKQALFKQIMKLVPVRDE